MSAVSSSMPNNQETSILDGRLSKDTDDGLKRKPKSMLVVSGGEGYIDFRIGKFFCSLEISESYLSDKSSLRSEVYINMP